MLGYPLETVIAEELSTAVALGDANTRDRDYAYLYRLIIRHDLAGSALRDALRTTAAYRNIQLRPLTEVLNTLVERRQNAYAAWRRRQGTEQAAYPERIRDVVTTVTAFADPLLHHGPVPGNWSSTDRRWW